MAHNADDMVLPFFKLFKPFKKRMEKVRNGFVPFSIMQIGLIHYIKRHDNARMKELAEFLEITPPSATTMVNKLVDIGFLRRAYDRRDRRTIIISLTEKGQRLFKRAEMEKRRIFEEMLSRITEDERKNLLRILEKMTGENN